MPLESVKLLWNEQLALLSLFNRDLKQDGNVDGSKWEKFSTESLPVLVKNDSWFAFLWLNLNAQIIFFLNKKLGILRKYCVLESR